MKIKLSQFSTNKNQILRFDANARIEIFIDNHDIESESDFESIMESNVSDDEKIAKLKEVALRIANERVDSIEGVQVSADLSTGSINIDSIDWIYMFERYQEDKQMMAEADGAVNPNATASTKTKIKLSQRQWETIGKKAGWIKQAGSDWFVNPEYTKQVAEILVGKGDRINSQKAHEITLNHRISQDQVLPMLLKVYQDEYSSGCVITAYVGDKQVSLADGNTPQDAVSSMESQLAMIMKEIKRQEFLKDI